MPVFKSGKGRAPAWCELEYFDIVRLRPGRTHAFERVGAKEKLIVAQGSCRITFAGRTVHAEANADLDLSSPDGCFEVTEVTSEATLVRMAGRWGEQVGGSGVFTLRAAGDRPDRGDPVDYPKDTSFDNHFHDCDEYWIILEGAGVVVTEGKSFRVGPGDCVATGMGHHHDFPQFSEPVRSVFFETTVEGPKRPGHLWEHTHGPAEPRRERV